MESSGVKRSRSQQDIWNVNYFFVVTFYPNFRIFNATKISVGITADKKSIMSGKVNLFTGAAQLMILVYTVF
jgi:hypothetical protein